LDTLLFHQRFCLSLCFLGCIRLAAFDPHGGFNGLDDFPVDSGCGLHASPQELIRRFGVKLKQAALADANELILTSPSENPNAQNVLFQTLMSVLATRNHQVMCLHSVTAS